MKNVNLIAQAKGGVGKSFITWFIAYVQKDAKTAFIDLDSTTRTSVRLKEIIDPSRVAEMSIIDGNDKLDREMFLNLFEAISKAKTTDWYIDMGAAESRELIEFFNKETGPEEFSQLLIEAKINLTIYVVIAGGDALGYSIKYYETIKNIVGEIFPVVALKNEGTFSDILEKEAADKMLEEMGIKSMKVGTTPLGNSRNEIKELISGKINVSQLSWAGKSALSKLANETKIELQLS